MKSFKSFIKKANLITAVPTHGKHAQEKPPIITAEPVHGKHAIKEDNDAYYDWNYHNDNSHLGKDTQDVHNKINLSTNQFKKKHGSTSVEHLHNYSAFSQDTNRHLIHKAVGGKSPFENNLGLDPVKRESNAKDMVHGVDHALKNSKLDHDLHVYHGTNTWHPGEESAKHSEGIVHLPTYLSTSISKSVGVDYTHPHTKLENKGHHILHIHLKKGQHGAYLGNNSCFDGEHEFLMPRDTKLKIHPEPTKLKYDGNDLHVWHAHVVDNEE